MPECGTMPGHPQLVGKPRGPVPPGASEGDRDIGVKLADLMEELQEPNN